MSPRDRLIVALDGAALAPALAVARRLRGLARTVKVGSPLFTSCGPEAIRRVRALGFEVMLDLKFFDIPSTVAQSCTAAVRHRVSVLTLHAAGGGPMLEAAVDAVRREAARLGIRRPTLLAVTVLTSAGIGDMPTRSRVLRLAETALAAGCDGVVASAQEARALRARFGRRIRIVCPGIRPPDAPRGDQQRVATPEEALAAGADALVVGRPITESPAPREAAKAILRAMERGRGC